MLKTGDEVIVPAVSWSTTYFPLQQFGLKLKFVDIDLETLNYDLDALKTSITNKTKMIVIVNLLGNPNDFEKINDIVTNKNIIVFEDNCESLGAEYKGKQTGTFGLLGTFSTYFSHHISTMEGGFVTTDNEELYHILLSIRAHGWTRNLPKKNHVTNISNNWFEESFRFVLPGYNVRPIEMSGAIGNKQLKKLPNFLKKRRENAKLFVDLFKNHDDFLIQKEVDKSSWFGFSLIIKPGSRLIRKDIINILEKNKIEYRPIVTGNFARNEVLKYFNYEIHKKLTNANHLHDNGFFVGNSHENLLSNIKLLKKILC
jgi:CDP-6-deoxy-D-xylo-4-hexulose-3-dehydrase